MKDHLRQLAEETRARPEAMSRVRAGVYSRISKPHRPLRRVVVPTLLLLGGSALAAGLLLPSITEEPLAGTVSPGQSRPAQGLLLEAEGTGDLGGTNQAPELDWQDGRLRLETLHSLRLRTREAELAVPRGRIEVERDPRGTRVSVEQGVLELRCLVEPGAQRLEAGAEALCLPVSAAGMLGRARLLEREGAPVEEILAAIAGGLTRSDSDPAARAELGLLQSELLAAAGRQSEALSTARAALAEDPPLRRQDLHRIAAVLSLALEGCPGAVPHLRALSAEQLDAAMHLAACDPENALAVLKAAEPLATTAEDRAALDAALAPLLGGPR